MEPSPKTRSIQEGEANTLEAKPELQQKKPQEKMLLKVWISKSREGLHLKVPSAEALPVCKPQGHTLQKHQQQLCSGICLTWFSKSKKIWEGSTSARRQVFRPKQFPSKKAWTKDTVFPWSTGDWFQELPWISKFLHVQVIYWILYLWVQTLQIQPTANLTCGWLNLQMQNPWIGNANCFEQNRKCLF